MSSIPKKFYTSSWDALVVPCSYTPILPFPAPRVCLLRWITFNPSMYSWGACAIWERLEKFQPDSHHFESSWDLAVRRRSAYWKKRPGSEWDQKKMNLFLRLAWLYANHLHIEPSVLSKPASTERIINETNFSPFLQYPFNEMLPCTRLMVTNLSVMTVGFISCSCGNIP